MHAYTQTTEKILTISHHESTQPVQCTPPLGTSSQMGAPAPCLGHRQSAKPGKSSANRSTGTSTVTKHLVRHSTLIKIEKAQTRIAIKMQVSPTPYFEISSISGSVFSIWWEPGRDNAAPLLTPVHPIQQAPWLQRSRHPPPLTGPKISVHKTNLNVLSSARKDF